MLKILFAASEAAPIAKVGGLGDVAGALPKALKNLGHDVRLVIPHYLTIETPSTLPGSQVPVYYVNSHHFDREKIYGYDDDPERFAYFSQALLKLTKEKGFEPNIIHVHDYHTSLVPVFLKTTFAKDQFFSETKTVLTIHNLSNQGVYNPNLLEKVGLKGNATPNLDWDLRNGDIDLLMQGISEADYLSTVSPTYAKEILTPAFGEGLQEKLKERQNRLEGILNGIDTEVYNPETDPNLAQNFSIQNPEKRLKNKESLIKELDLKNNDWPVFGVVTRLVEQKGLDLIEGSFTQLGDLPLNLVFLGLGEQRYEKALLNASNEYSNIKVSLEFNEAKARRIYAGSDFFLVPSRFEPSGLTQMIAMRYGSVPLAHKTGGLADTVFDGKNGLVFEDYTSDAFLAAISRALDLYQNKKELATLQKNGMSQDFSWEKPAREYVKLYQRAMEVPKNWP